MELTSAATYSLLVKTPVSEWRPRRLLTGEEVLAYALDALAMLGCPVPDALRDTGFPAMLAERGEYRVDAGDVNISVRRSAEPNADYLL